MRRCISAMLRWRHRCPPWETQATQESTIHCAACWFAHKRGVSLSASRSPAAETGHKRMYLKTSPAMGCHPGATPLILPRHLHRAWEQHNGSHHYMHCLAGDSSTAWLSPSVDRIQAAFGAVKKAASLPATAVGSHAVMQELRQEIAAQARERRQAAAAAEAAAEETAAGEVCSRPPASNVNSIPFSNQEWV